MRRSLCSVFLLGMALSAPAFAQEAESSSAASSATSVRVNMQNNMEVLGDFTLGPARFLLPMGTGSVQTVEVQLTNRTGDEAVFLLHTEDFASDQDEESTPRFFEQGTEGPYPARLWVEPETDRIRLRHGERAFVRVTVRVPDDAEPGDHQAAVIVSQENAGTGRSGFIIQSRVASLFVITVAGDVDRRGTIESLQSRHHLNWSYPVHLRLRARNDGNVHIAPIGSVEVRNIFGVPVDEIPVRDWIILRDAARPFDFAWNPRFALGYYTATANLTIAGAATDPVSVSFWVIPLLPVLIVLLAIFLVSFLVQYFFSRFEISRKRD